MKNILSLFFLLFLSNVVIAQAPNDCVNALTVCGNGTFSSNATGSGNTQEINSCGGFESNSIWLEVHIVQAGTLGFNLIPNDPSTLVDYDFWVYGPNVTCGALGSPIRCATTNPDEAGLTTNLTGMNGATLLTQTGPGSNGNGYVRWLTVVPGQSYYIAIDRPAGDGGFQIQWIGTATAGTGAFPSSPTANAIPDVLTCSNTPNVGIFDLNAVRSLINPDTTNNLITFHTTLANAIDGISPLPNIYANTSNPQTIYVIVTDIVSGCNSLTDFDLVVNLVPNATIGISATSICLGDSVTVTFTGTPNAKIDYNIDGGTTQTAFLNASGTFTITESPATNRTYTLTNVRIQDGLGNTLCTQPLNLSVSVVVNPIPTVTISGTTTICSGTSAVITFTGTPNATATYTIDSGANQTILLDTFGVATITTPLLTVNSTYNLVSVASATTPICSQTQTGSAVVTVSALPTATISGTTTICSGSSTVITFSGTPNATVTYTINSGVNLTTVLDSAGNATLNAFALTVNTTFTLVSASFAGSATCSQPLSGSAVITISAPPTATISGTTTICSGNTTVITFTGTPNATVTYTINSGVNQNIVLDGSGLATLTTLPLSANTTYDLVSATLTGTPPCSQTLSGSAVITVNPSPTVTISGTTTICSGTNTSITFTGTPNATVTYTINSGSNLTTVLNGSGTSIIPTPNLTADSTYALVSVISATLPVCSQPQSGSAVVTVKPLPTATISGTTTICSGTTAVITFNGTPNATVTYTVNSGSNLSIVLDGSGSATLTTLPLTANTTYALVSVVTAGIPACSQGQTGSAIITVNALPIAAISGTTTICSGTTTAITFTGTPNATVTYTINSGPNQTIVLSGTGSASFTTLVLTANTTYALVSVTSAGLPVCSQTQSGSAVVTVLPLPTVTISGTTAICSGTTTAITFNGTPNATVTYTINSGSNLTILLSVSGSVVITTPPLTANSTYALVSVTTAGIPACSQPQSGSAVVTVNPIPAITNVPANRFVCAGDLVTTNAFVSSPVGANFTWTNSNSAIGLAASGTGNIPNFTAVNNGTIAITATINISATLNSCPVTGSYTITVNPIPQPNPVITDYKLCDYNNPGDGVEIFNLGTKSAEIANGQPGVTVSYYVSLADAQSQTSPLTNLYPNTTNPQKIWINIRDNATGCNTTSSFNLIVNPLPSITQPQPIFQCSNGIVLTAIFDLTINEGVVTSNVTGLDVSYYHSLADAQTETSPIPTPDNYLGTDNEIVYIRVENISTGCYATTTQLLRVTQGPVAVTPQPLQYCDPNNDGFGVFNLEDATNEIAGGTLPAGVSVTYHETEADALIGARPLSSPYFNITPNNQTIYVHVFYTLTGGCCDNYVQLQLIVNPTPVATTPQPYELCDYTGATGYEAFNLNSVIPEILGTISPSLTSVTFYTTLQDAQDETSPINNPGNYTNITPNNQIIYVHVETIATGCFDIVELQLIVNPLPNSTQPNYPQYSLCDNDQTSIGYETFDLGSKIDDILLGQTGMDVRFYISLGDAQNGTGEITNLMYTNQIQYVQTLGITITNHITGCFVISTMDIRVEPLPVLIPPTQPYTICDGNQDGFSCDFNLSSLVADMLSTANYTLTFYETLTDAQTGNPATVINTALPYCNIHPFVQILYVRAEDNVTHCVSVLPIELNVDASPIAPVALDDITVCDNDSNPQSGTTLVDLTQQTAEVLAQQPLPASSYTVTYYNTQAAAQSPTGAGEIIPANNYMGSNGETIWVRVENNITGCFNVSSFELEINIPLLLTTPTPLSLCDDDATPNNQFHVFNLTVKDAEITNNLNVAGYTVTYYPSLLDAQNSTNVISATDALAYQNVPAHPAVQTLGVVVTTPAGCTSITTLDIRVLPIPTPLTNPPALAPKCDDNNPGDMVEVFDLTVNEAYIKNGDNTLTLHYYYTQADAEVPQNEIIPANAVSVGANVWIRVENTRVDFEGNHCYVLVEQALTVNPLPTVVQPLPPYRVCDDNADGIAQFDLTNPLLAPQILGATQLPADYTVSYYLTQANAASGTSPLPSPYTNVTPTTQNIYIRVVNNATGCVNATGVLTLAVEAYATATGPQTFTECDSYMDPYDGVDQVDLTQFETAILNGQNPAIFLVSYYRSLADATAGTNPLSAAEAAAYVMDTADTDTVWVKVENSSNTITPFCYALTTIEITIERYPNPIINTPNGVTTICVDYNTNAVIRPLTLDSGITNTTNYSFEWYEAGDPTTILGSGPTYTVDTPAAGGATRSYTVHVTSSSALGCDTTSQAFEVLQSGPAVIPAGSLGYTVSNAFSDSQTITVLIEGYGTYEYSLDDGPRQTSNIFEGVSFGGHIIHVWDSEGGVAYSCEQLIIYDVQIIDYPHYFTPNGDGIHDNWNIVGLDNQPAARIYIFDRYGKLLKQISSTGQGWDGTYNGHLLPADDYWFSVDYIENATAKQFKAHFTLKR